MWMGVKPEPGNADYENHFHPAHLISLLNPDFERNYAPAPSSDRKLRAAAVLIPIIYTRQGWSLVYTRRSDQLQKHRGQVAFPGGSVDAEDLTIAETALREAWEEIALPKDHVNILGVMDSVESTSGFFVTPVVGWIHTPFEAVANAIEVARVFTVPLAWLAEKDHVQFRSFETPWGRQEGVIFFEPYDNELVWGFTGGVTLDFLHLAGWIESIPPS